MRYGILIQPTPDGRVRAFCGTPFNVEAFGATANDALTALAPLVAAAAPGPVELVPVFPDPANPWLRVAGSMPDDDLARQWQSDVDAYRRECDSAADPKRSAG